MKKEDIKKVQVFQLEIMDEVHKLCVKHGITYYMIGGTLLGAVRHKGFIPWDLDIDIAMCREEYDRFKGICKTELDSKYSYLDHINCRRYIPPHALLTRNDTKIHSKYDHLNPKTFDFGVYIDIFPLDNAPDDERLRQKQAALLKKIRRFKEYRLPYSYSYKAWKRYAHYAVSALLSWISIPKLNQYQQDQMKKYNDQGSECICSMASQYAYTKQCMSRDVYGTPILLEFEGRQYFAPEKYTEYLTRLYGDYMQLPPVEKRLANLEVFASVEFFS